MTTGVGTGNDGFDCHPERKRRICSSEKAERPRFFASYITSLVPLWSRAVGEALVASRGRGQAPLLRQR